MKKICDMKRQNKIELSLIASINKIKYHTKNETNNLQNINFNKKQEMSVHDKMNADYVWIRNAPVEEGLKVRNHGNYFMYDRAPNRVERLEMIYRSIGKQYDWELEKYRLGKKGIDRANKKRGFKNLFRFIKNPAGYIYWRTAKNFPTMPKTMVVSFIALWVLAIWQMKAYSLSVDAVDQQLILYGKNVEGSQGRMKGFHKRTAVITPNFWDAFFRSPLMANQIEINPTWRQNIRKELQLTNAHNVAF